MKSILDLLHYIQGFRKGKNAHRIEKEAMTDPFLSDALEGYESVEGNHIETVFRLQQKILGRTKRKNRTRIWWAAACAILVIGISVYVFFPEQEDMLVSQKLHTKESQSDVSEAEFEAYDERLSDSELPEKSEQSEIPPLEAPVAAAGKGERSIVHEAQSDYADQAISLKLVADESESKIIISEEIAETPIPSLQRKYAESSNKEKKAPDKKSNTIAIKGHVVDNTGEPIIGASVLLKGTTTGAVTNSDGYFDLRIDSVLSKYNDLNVSYIGYESQLVKLKNKNEDLSIVLRESTQTLDEVVIVGMGAQSKKSMTGAVATVSPKSPAESPVPTIGMKEYTEYLNNNAVQPTDQECAKAKGKVKLSFYINASGRPYNIKVEKSLCPSCDQKAIELIQNGVDWTYGTKIVKIDVSFKGK